MIKSSVIIIGCPRSGTTLLYNILSEVSSFWSTGYESKAIIERFHHPSEKDWASGALDENDLTPVSRAFILEAFELQAAPGTFWRRINRFRAWLRQNPLWKAIKHRGRTEQVGSSVSSAVPQRGLDLITNAVRLRNTLLRHQDTPIRLLEKTPENCLRLPFLLALFPDARIIYLIRDGRNNVNSLIEGWKQPYLFPGYQVPVDFSIPGYTRGRWAFTLIPGWRDLVDTSLEEISARQWVRCNEAALAHREETARTVPYLTVRYEDLIAQPGEVLPQIANFIGVDFELDLGRFAEGLPRINVVSAPGREKWRRQNFEAIQRVLPIIDPMMMRLGYNSKSS
jgi:hypothetical protein